MASERIVIIETTLPSEEKAKKVASKAIKSKLAACVHLQKIKSIYWWEEKIETADEIKLSFKTRERLSSALLAFLREIHPYEVPEIVIFKAHKVHKPYALWIHNTTKKNIKENI